MAGIFYSNFIDSKNTDPRFVRSGTKTFAEQGYSGKTLSGNKALLHIDLINVEKLCPLEQVDTTEKFITAFHETAKLAGNAIYHSQARNPYHRDFGLGMKVRYDNNLRDVNSYNRFTVLIDFNKGKTLEKQVEIVDFLSDIQVDPGYGSFQYFGIKKPTDERDYIETRNLLGWAERMSHSKEVTALYLRLVNRQNTILAPGGFISFAASEVLKKAIGKDRKNGLALMSYDCRPNMVEPYCYSKELPETMTNHFSCLLRKPSAYFNNVAWLHFKKTGQALYTPEDVKEISEYLNTELQLYQPSYGNTCYYTPKEPANIVMMNKNQEKIVNRTDSKLLCGVYIHPSKLHRLKTG
jgi:hypothetical protein